MHSHAFFYTQGYNSVIKFLVNVKLHVWGRSSLCAWALRMYLLGRELKELSFVNVTGFGWFYLVNDALTMIVLLDLYN